MRAEDEYKTWMNIISRVGLENALEEYAKTSALLNRFDSMQSLQGNPSVNPSMMPQTGQSATQGELGEQIGQNSLSSGQESQNSNITIPQ